LYKIRQANEIMEDVSVYIYWGNLAGLPLILENKVGAINIAEVV